MTPLSEPIEITAQNRIDAEVLELLGNPPLTHEGFNLIGLLYHKEQGLLEMRAELEKLKEAIAERL